MFAAFILPVTALCWGVLYFGVMRGVLKRPLGWVGAPVSFLLAWFFAAIPGFLYGQSVYSGVYMLVAAGCASIISLAIFWTATCKRSDK